MGANCCVAAKSKPLPDDARIENSTCRNIRYSPSWSFRWDNRTHIEDIVDRSARISRHSSREISSEIKSGTEMENEVIPNQGSPSDPNGNNARNSRDDSQADLTCTAHFQRFSIHVLQCDQINSLPPMTDQSVGSKPLAEETTKLAGMASASDVKSSTYTSVPSSSTLHLGPASSESRSRTCDPTSSRRARRSPGYQLSRQVSDGTVPSLKSLNENSSPEERFSFMHSISGNDLSLGGSQGGSSDGWSMRMFSELVASSQRERWSFDSENLSSTKGKLVRSNTQPSSLDHPTCGICSKVLKERSPWSPQKMVSISDLSVVAVLVCGHVYHAECLENMTTETDRFEPPCPICTNGEKSALKLSRKAELKARSKISRTAVADADVDGDPVSECRKHGGKGSKMGASSSMKGAFVRPFLRRHFSLGSGITRSVSENDSFRKRGFWGRYRRD